MSVPPPPPNQGQPPQPGGGFGPPQGFGPPASGGPSGASRPDGYGYPNPYGQGGYGQAGHGPGGGYGPGAQPGWGAPQGPPPGGGGGAKAAAVIIGAVVVLTVVVGGLLLLTGGDDEPDPVARPSAPAAETGLPSSEATAPEDDGFVSPSPGTTDKVIPYIELRDGECFDHPNLDSGVTEVERRTCDSSHDGEVVGTETLTGSFDTETELQDKAVELCEPLIEKAGRRITDGRSYYEYVVYPQLSTYEISGRDHVACALTLSNGLDGPKLTSPLP